MTKTKVQSTNRLANLIGESDIQVSITPPNFVIAQFLIEGDAPLCINKFSKKAMDQMSEKQAAGHQATKGKKRQPKDFQDCFEQARHKSVEGWDGLAAASFRKSMISACRTVDFKMTRAKQSFFVLQDGIDATDGTPLVKITKGQPKRVDAFVRNASGVADIRPRPVWDVGWQAIVRIKYDADLFSATDITNLLSRAGVQVGVGEGRPDAPNGGTGYGTFFIVTK